MDREYILDEIKRTAAENGGRPLGMGRFEQVTGIRRRDWEGKCWARWNDAISEAGLEPNVFGTDRYDPEVLIKHWIAVCR